MFLIRLSATGIAWFPQEYATAFYVIKGMCALLSTTLLLYHMTQVWPYLRSNATIGQRMRYYSLLAFSILVTGASGEQVQDGALVNYRNLGSLIVTIMLIVAMVISIREDAHKR